MTDDAILPAMTGDDQQIVFLSAIAANLAEGDVEALGADADGLTENLVQIPLAKREAAEPGNRRLLAKQLLNLGSSVRHGDGSTGVPVSPHDSMDRRARDLYP